MNCAQQYNLSGGFLTSLTSDSELSSGMAVFSLAGVFPCIALLNAVDDQFNETSLLPHLILVSTLQDHSAFPPVHWSSGFGELTTENSTFPFLHHQALDFSFECHRKRCSG